MTSYLGSKAASGAFQAVIGHMPPHDTYVETHYGGGAVVARKPACSRTLVNDLDASVFDRFPAPDGAETSSVDAAEFLDRLDLRSLGRVLVYADPPYVHCTRSSRKRYVFEYDDDGHRRLSESLMSVVARGGLVMVSGYPSALYEKLFAGWRTMTFQVMTRGGPRTEQLWMSFPEQASHWTSFAGANFTDRQRIKRKAERWATRYALLPPAERQAVLSALLQASCE